MRAIFKSRRTTSILGATALLAGCGGPQPPMGAAATILQGQSITTHAKVGKSWMLPEAKHEDLLYVSDASNGGSVNVYAYRSASHKLVGTLTGINPAGQCVDKAGNIWITKAAGGTSGGVAEYAHGATSPTKTLTTRANAVGCSVSPNGDVAVSTAFATSGGGYDIQVFKNASGAPTSYKNQSCEQPWTPGYDDKGNLYVEGREYISNTWKVHVCELPAGGTTLKPVSFNGLLVFAGSVMWDGRHITLSTTNDTYTDVFRARESSSGNLTVVGTTKVVDGSCNAVEDYQVFIVGRKNTPANTEEGSHIVAGNSWEGCYYDFDGWSYPAGGAQDWSLSIRYAVGEAVSIAK